MNGGKNTTFQLSLLLLFFARQQYEYHRWRSRLPQWRGFVNGIFGFWLPVLFPFYTTNTEYREQELAEEILIAMQKLIQK